MSATLRVILVGSGRIIYYLARQLVPRGYQVTMVTSEAEEARELSQRVGRPAMCGDATDPGVLELAGAFQADAVMAMTPHDEDNLAICQIASQMYKVPRTIALVNDPENEEIFHRLKVSVAISATRILAILFEEQAGFEAVRELVTVAEGKVSVAEVVLRDGCPAQGATIESLQLPAEALVGGVIRAGRVVIPKGSTCLQGGDRLILIATEASLDDALRILSGASPA